MPTVTLAQLETRVWDGLDANTLFYPEDNIRRVINEGLRRLNLLTGFTQVDIAVSGFSVAGRLVYTVPSGVLLPQRVYFEQRELEKLSLRQLGAQFRNWTVDSNASIGPVSRWCPIGINQFVIHPLDSYGGQLIEVSGVGPITPLVAQGDTVSLNNELTDILVDYARSRSMLKEGGKPFADASMAYQQMISKVKTMMIWDGMNFPRYFLVKELEPAAGRGA